MRVCLPHAALTMQPSYPNINPYPQPGEVLDGKYQIERLLGEGGMGAVAKATHLLRRAPVALKFMSGAVLSMQGAVERFVNEGVAASQIDSDHVVKVFDVGRMPSGAPYLVMEYLEGLDLSQLLERDGPIITPPRAVHFTLQMLRALHTAHAAHVVHRDMKPSNCFVIEKDGEPDFIKLVDFGISKVRSADDKQAVHLTRTNSALGTPLYMSPEQARSPKDVDHRADLYSVGAILYEMLSGRTPYTADSGEYTEILFKLFTAEPEPLRALRPDLPEGLTNVVHRALLRDREARFRSAVEMAEALAPYADERSAQLIVRARAGVARSIAARSVSPQLPSARITQEQATAQTYALDDPASLRAPRVPTDVGVTREASGAGQPVRGAGKTGIAVAVLALAVLTVTAGMLAVRSRTSPSVETSHAAAATAPQVRSAATTESTTIATIAPAPTAAPTVVLAPLPSASTPSAASASAAPNGAKLPGRPAPSAGGQSQLPTQLGDVRFH